MLEYKFIEIPAESGFMQNSVNNFDKCREVVEMEAKKGWRLKQILLFQGGMSGSAILDSYQIILEKEQGVV